MIVEALCPKCKTLWKSDDIQIGKVTKSKQIEFSIREMCVRFLCSIENPKTKVRILKGLLADTIEEDENKPEPIDPRQTRLFDV